MRCATVRARGRHARKLQRVLRGPCTCSRGAQGVVPHASTLQQGSLQADQQNGSPALAAAPPAAPSDSSRRQTASRATSAELCLLPAERQDTHSFAVVQTGVRPQDAAVGKALRDIRDLSLPALGSTLADPICSLADTACIGQVSSLQLAALSPCTAIFNLVFLVFQFLGVTLMNKLASNDPLEPGLSEAERDARQTANTSLVQYSTGFALLAGTLTSAVMWLFGPQILTAMGTSSVMLGPALDYLRWRSLAAPAVMMMNVCQGICLGQKNAITPLAVFSAVGLLNVALDVWLILGHGIGCAGVGMITAVAQWAGAMFFTTHLQRKGAEGKSVEMKFPKLPSLEDLKPFIGMASVLLSRTVFTMAAYTAITFFATLQGTVSAATHQVCLQVFWFLSFFPEPLSVAAQTLIARSQSSLDNALLLARCVLKVGASLGVALASACALCFLYGASAFTTDAMVAGGMLALALPGSSALLLCALAMIADGISIGSSDYKHLPWVNLAGLTATLGYLSHCNAAGLGLASIWNAFSVMFGVRLVGHALHHLAPGRESLLASAMKPEAGSQDASREVDFVATVVPVHVGNDDGVPGATDASAQQQEPGITIGLTPVGPSLVPA